jgi:hypothetical protein
MDRFFAAAKAIAVPRALNTLRDQAEVAGLRAVAEKYQISARAMREGGDGGGKWLSEQDATLGDLEASITVRGRGFPLSQFKPLKTPTGVSVLIKGKRVTIPHAFMVKRFGAHVFARGSYGGKSGGLKPTGETLGRFVYGAGRLPIQELYTFGPAEAFSNDDVTQAMKDRVAEQAPKVFAREMAAVKRGF